MAGLNHHYAPDTLGYRLIKSEVDYDCGCLEEEWECPVGGMSFHLRPNGYAEVVFDNGDCEWEIEIHGGNQEGFWAALVKYIDELPILDD